MAKPQDLSTAAGTRHAFSKLKVLNTIAFVVFCMAVGHVTATFATNLLYDVDLEIETAFKDPTNSNAVMVSSVLYTVFSFFIIPTIYLFLVRGQSSVQFIWPEKRIRTVPLLLSVASVLTVAPFISVLIEFNHSIHFPIWLTDVETYFKESESNANELPAILFSSTELMDVVISILIMAIIPGIAEELFFRGIVQRELQSVFRSGHHAIFLTAFLFSFFHFQFYGLIPRFAVGVLLGYLFFITNNIWYSCAAHVANNVMSIVLTYLFAPRHVTDDVGGGLISMWLVMPSIAITVYIVFLLKAWAAQNPLQTPG